jgi:4-hydroxybenzoate polyprenyltransferase
MPFALIGFFLGLFHQHFGAIPFDAPFPDEGRISDLFGRSELFLFILVIGCMVTARTAAMAFNRYLDRTIDALNPRTAIREIPRGIIKPRQALFFALLNASIFCSLTYFINPICFYLSPVALMVILGYSYTKRFTPLCHLVLGLGLALAPIGAYLAVTGIFNWLPLLFSFSVICWVSGFDIIYSLQDEAFDRSQSLYSIPAGVGRHKALQIARLLHVFSALFILFAGLLAAFSWIYWMGVAGFWGMLIYQHRLVKPDDLSRVNIAFMTANGVASVVFSIFVLIDIFY